MQGRDRASGTIDKVAAKAQQSLGGLARRAAGFAAGFIAVDSGMRLLSESLGEFVEAEDASRRLGITLANLGSRTTVTSQQVEELAKSIHQTTVYEDDAAVASASFLLGLRGLSEQGFSRALRLSADMAAQMGGDLPEAAELLAQALAAPEKAVRKLRTAGIFLTDTELEKIKAFKAAGDSANAYAAVMDAVADRTRGAAERMASTTGGQIKQLEKQWNDLKEQLGERLVESGVIEGSAELLKDRPKTTEELRDELRTATTGVPGAVRGAIHWLTGSEVADTTRIRSELAASEKRDADEFASKRRVFQDKLDAERQAKLDARLRFRVAHDMSDDPFAKPGDFQKRLQAAKSDAAFLRDLGFDPGNGVRKAEAEIDQFHRGSWTDRVIDGLQRIGELQQQGKDQLAQWAEKGEQLAEFADRHKTKIQEIKDELGKAKELFGDGLISGDEFKRIKKELTKSLRDAEGKDSLDRDTKADRVSRDREQINSAVSETRLRIAPNRDTSMVNLLREILKENKQSRRSLDTISRKRGLAGAGAL